MYKDKKLRKEEEDRKNLHELKRQKENKNR